MNTARKKEVKETVDSILQIIFGGQYISPEKKQRINDFWEFCHSTFWSTENFSDDEKNEFKQLIEAHFKNCEDENQKFIELVERAVLAKRYVKRRSGRYVAKPIDWLNINFRSGLSGTERWYKELTAQRKTVPHYNEGISLLANAILDFSKCHQTHEIPLYRNELIKHKQNDLVFYYTNAIMHFLFI